MDSLPSLFDITYLINLPERIDRLKAVKKQFARVNWRVGARDVNIFPALRFPDPAGFPNAAIRGCFHSHLECLRQALADRRQSVMILEDDIALTSSLPRLTSSIKLQLAHQEWDFVYFGHYATGDIPSADRHTHENEVGFDVWTEDIIGAHFYAVSGRILPRLIGLLSKMLNGPIEDPDLRPMVPDGAYNVFRRRNSDIRCLIAHPKLGWQSSSRSDLTPHPLDRFAVFRPMNSFLRTLKQMGSRWRS